MNGPIGSYNNSIAQHQNRKGTEPLNFPELTNDDSPSRHKKVALYLTNTNIAKACYYCEVFIQKKAEYLFIDLIYIMSN